MPGDKEVVKRRTTQQKKVYAEDSSDEQSIEDSPPQPKKSKLSRAMHFVSSRSRTSKEEQF